jgi:hypothetical protein
VDQVRNAVRDNAGFPAPGTGEDQHRSIDVRGRVTLLRV